MRRGSKGLCYRCYGSHGKPGVRHLYPSLDPVSGVRSSLQYREPTEAELDALIAEQMKCLPPWWEEETRRMERGERDD